MPRAMAGLLCLVLCHFTGCFRVQEPDCAFTCTYGSSATPCPNGYECKDDGFCHREGSVGACGAIDDDAGIGDAAGADAPDSDAMHPSDGADGPTVCSPGAKESCYSGPAGTAGIGVCALGERTCSPDGQGWSGCVGEVVPSTEAATCDGKDSDCDGLDCGPLTRTYGGKTYMFHMKGAPFADATAQCASEGLHLVTIDDATENQWLVDTLRALDPKPYAGGIARIGLNDRATEGTFVWSDGSSASYRRWSPTSPNNGSGGIEYDCVGLMYTDSTPSLYTYWCSTWCDFYYAFVCESP
jgi:hypothetical protein